jgi:hypothetical protein
MKGKLLRAVRQGKIHICGTFPELKDELCQLMPGEVPSRSPDRADAAVFACFELRHLSHGSNWMVVHVVECGRIESGSPGRHPCGPGRLDRAADVHGNVIITAAGADISVHHRAFPRSMR